MRKEPSTTRTNATTPRYWSYDESKISARAGASGSPDGGGIRSTTASRTSSIPWPVLAEIRRTSSGVPADQLRDLRGRRVGIGLRQIDLVDDREQLEVVLDRQVGVGDRLRLHALCGVHDQHGALARLQRPRHLVGEVDVPRRVDQVELVPLPEDANGLRLDGDPALALEVHGVEQLLAHLPSGDGVGDLQDAIGQGRFPVVDVRDDREVADSVQLHRSVGRAGAGAQR